jgi:hypothetical protein
LIAPETQRQARHRPKHEEWLQSERVLTVNLAQDGQSNNLEVEGK